MKKRFILSVAVIILMVLCLFTACGDFNNPDEIEDDSSLDPTELTINLWSDGIFSTEKKEQWFKFTATAATHYFHFKKGTLNYDVNSELYKGKSTVIPNSSKTISDNNNISYLSLNIGQTYYIKLTPRRDTDTGTYNLGFTTSTSSPDIIAGADNSARLLIDQWSESGFSAIENERWFKFTPTVNAPALTYIHFQKGTLDNVNIRIYNNAYNPFDTNTSNLYDSNSYKGFALTVGQQYYIKVTPRWSNTTGTFKIGFTNSAFSPDAVAGMNAAIQLSINTWSSGNISLEVKEQWFKFTATASVHYIYFQAGTLNNVSVQLFGSSGVAADTAKDLNASNTYTTSSVTIGQTYYIKVTPSSNGTGTYKIGYTNNTTAPSL